MTRKNYALLAMVLRQEREALKYDAPKATNEHYWGGKLTEWETLTLKLTAVLEDDNPRFDRERFLMVAGYRVRPDGSLWRVDPYGKLLPIKYL